MIEEVKKLLKQLGYEVKREDDYYLEFAVEKAESEVKSFCNISTIIKQLEQVVTQKAAGYFLHMKNSLGQLKDFIVNETVVKSIQVGDTNTTFAISDSSPELKLNGYIQLLIDSGYNEMMRYRRLIW